MESRYRAAKELSEANLAKVRWRFRLLTCCLALTAVAFVQQPGRIVTDTKLDLTINPSGFLERALHMWDPASAFGQVQNQAYGYLFPMGPFFAAGHTLGLEPWAVQRLWWTMLLCVAFLGMVKLSGLLEIGTPWVRVLAGFAFALSPRLLTVIGPSSIEVWPAAVAPWVLIPLVLAVRRGNPRRYAALSALAVACAGGVNAAATFAVIPLASLWILTSPAGPRRKSLVRWWPPLVLLGTLWWIVPLFLLGAYSPPFLDYIETASVTSLATDLFDVLRGTVNWIPYIDPNSIGGNQLVTSSILILNGAVVVTLGVVGLSRRDLPHRRFLVAALVVGIVMVAASHDGAGGGVLAPGMQSLLDGVLAPLRNTHKFEVVVRIPVVLGLAHLISVYLQACESPGDEPSRRQPLGIGLAILATAAVFSAASPAWTADLANRGSVTEIPGYWTDTADWLSQHDAGTALLVPASGFGNYAWGRTNDEPMQPLAKSSWAVRNLIPLAPGGNIEMLDAISARIATGRGDEGFSAFLQRAGISYLVVRNDLDKTQDVIEPELVYSTLRSTPGVSSVAQFGPQIGGEPFLPTRTGRSALVNDGWQSSHPAVEIFRVAGVKADSVQTVTGTPVLVGNAKSLMALDSLGVTAGSNTILSQDLPAKSVPGSYVLADGQRSQEDGFGTVNHNRSNSLSASDEFTIDRPIHRYDEKATASWMTTPRLEGARRISVSSSQSSVDVLPFTRIDESPWAAFDGDPATAWHASTKDVGSGSWVQIDLDGRTDLGRVGITLDTPKSATRRITVTTQEGPKTVTAQGGSRVVFDVGTVSSLRISGSSSLDAPFAVSEVDWVHQDLSRPLVLPDVPSSWGAPASILFDAGEGYTSGCLTIDDSLRCGAKKSGFGEDGRVIDRAFATPAGATYAPTFLVSSRGSAALDAVAQQGKLLTIESSSRVVESPEASPVHLIDGSRRTGWVASSDDPTPSVTMRWIDKRRISAIAVATAKDLPGTPAKSATLEFSDGTTRSVLLRSGRASFPAVKADSVIITLVPGKPQFSIDYRGGTQPLPVGANEISLHGLEELASEVSDSPADLPCGSGPVVRIDGFSYESAVTASPESLLAGDRLPARICGASSIKLAPGKHRVTVQGNDAFRPVDLLLSQDGARTIQASTPVSGGGNRTVDLRAGTDATFLTTTHNTNAGWRAEVGGSQLEPAVLNGWQQAWVVPAGVSGPADLSYAPDRTYRIGLTIGGLCFVALLLLVGLRWGNAPSRASEHDGPRWHRHALPVALLVALGLAVSPWGVLAAAVASGIALMGERKSPGDMSWLAGGFVLAAGIWASVRPWAGPDGWFGASAGPQILVAMSLGVMIARLLSRPTLRQR